MNHRQLSSSSEAPVFEVPGWWGAVKEAFGELLRTRSMAVLVLAVTLGLLNSRAANAQVINYPTGFTSSCCFSSNGGSGPIWLQDAVALSGTSLQLTQVGQDHGAGNATYSKPVNIQAFTTTFTFQIVCSGGSNNCANGVGFMIICDCASNFAYPPGYNYSGFSGNQFSWSQCPGLYNPQTGFSTCAAINETIVKFDTFNITTGTFGASLTGFCSGGTYCEPPQNVSYDMSGSGINLTSGDVFSANITYNGSTLSETLTDTSTGAQYARTYAGVDLPDLIGATTAFVGFGAGTGDTATQSAYVNSWTYTVETPGQAAPPVFSPAAGTYAGTQNVTLSTASQGAIVCYNTTGGPTTNGSTSCATGTLYTGPVTVSSSETLYAVAGGAGYTDSAAVNATYVVQTSVATPTFSPGGGTYSSAQSVAISDTTSGATFYYTTNGTTPNTSSTKYTGPIPISSTETLKAIAVVSGYTNSQLASAAYTITVLPAVSSPTFLPPAGSYNSAQSVSISDATPGANVYYTTDGTMPTTSSMAYTGPVTVASSESLEAIAVATGDANSPVASAVYAINLSPPVVSMPAFSPAAGSYNSSQLVTLSDATSNATIYYTTNGTTPTMSSTAYTGPVTVASTETLEAIAVVPGDAISAVAAAAYTITLPLTPTPTFSPLPGAYTSAQSVSISDAASGAAIYYTTNATPPTTSSIEYTGPITMSSTETLEAIAVSTGGAHSAIASAAYTLSSSLPSVTAPTFSPAAGSYSSVQLVSISDATPGGIIHYTTNGSTPAASSTAYTGPITVSSTETLQAIAVSTGGASSAVAAAAYTITSSPNFLLAASTSSLAVTPGGQGTVTLTVTPQNGFDSPVILACSAPSWATCSFEESTVTPAGGAATTQLTISTSGQVAASQTSSRLFFPLSTLAFTVGLFGRRKRRGQPHWLLLALASASLAVLFGCTASSGGGGISSVPAGTSTTSTVTVTAISGVLQGTAAIAVTVK